MSVFSMTPALLVAVVITAALPASAQPGPTPARTLTMTGIGEVRIAPDIATITAGVVTQGRTAREALAANTARMSRILARFQALEIAGKDLQTSNFSVNPRYSRDPKSKTPPRIVGYTVANALTVVVRDLSRLGSVLDEAISVGANTMQGPNFSIADPTALRNQARANAAADARVKADIYAKALGVRLVAIMRVEEVGNTYAPPRPMRALAMAAERVGVPIAQGEQAIVARVNVVWEIAPGE